MSEAGALRWRRRYAKPLVLGGLTLVAYIGALNRGQALIWGIAAILLGTLVTSFGWPRWLVQRLEVGRTGPSRATEGETITLGIVVKNIGWFPRYMIEVTDHLPFVGAASGAPGSNPVLLGQIAYVPTRGSRSFEVAVSCEKRGLYRLGPVGMASSFPLGMAQARRQKNGGVQMLVIYPAVFPIMALNLRGTPSLAHRGGFLLPEGAGTAEFRGLRDYRPGDNPRHVHWATSARLNKLIIKEFEPLAAASLVIALDLDSLADAGQGKHSTLEYMVKIAASIARHACESGMPIQMQGQGHSPFRIQPGSGEAHYAEILEALAVVAADGRIPYADVLQGIAPGCAAGETLVAFLSGTPDQDDATLHSLAMLRAQGLHLFAVLFDRASFTAPHAASPPQPPSALLAGLQELGAHVVEVRCGDDLVNVFNA